MQGGNLLSISAGSVCVRSRWKVAIHGAEWRSSQGSRRVKTIHLLFRTGVNVQAPLCCCCCLNTAGETRRWPRSVVGREGGPHLATPLTCGAAIANQQLDLRSVVQLYEGRDVNRFTAPHIAFSSPIMCNIHTWSDAWVNTPISHSLWLLIGFILVYVSRLFVTCVNIHQVGANCRLSAWKEARFSPGRIKKAHRPTLLGLPPACLRWQDEQIRK